MTKPKRSNRQLTDEQCTKMLSIAESEMKGFILIGMTTGQRIADIIAIKRVDVDLANSVLRFKIATTGVMVEMALDPRVRLWIEQQPESTIPIELDTPLFPQLANRGAAKTAAFLRKLGERTGVSLDALSFRRTFFGRLK